MNFHKVVMPFIKEHMNKVFNAYDGYGAEIVFYNGLSVLWEFDDKSNIKKVVVELDDYIVEGKDEQAFSEIMSMVKMFTASEIEHLKAKKRTDEQYVKIIKEVYSKLGATIKED